MDRPDFSDDWLPGERESQDDDIGIPNVPGILEYHRRRLREWRLERGLCPECATPLVDGGDEEYCPNCPRDE